MNYLKKGKVEVLKEMFPDLNEDKVKQALECANSDVTLAINKVHEDTSEYLCMSLSQSFLLNTLYFLCVITGSSLYMSINLHVDTQ